MEQEKDPGDKQVPKLEQPENENIVNNMNEQANSDFDEDQKAVFLEMQASYKDKQEREKAQKDSIENEKLQLQNEIREVQKLLQNQDSTQEIQQSIKPEHNNPTISKCHTFYIKTGNPHEFQSQKTYYNKTNTRYNTTVKYLRQIQGLFAFRQIIPDLEKQCNRLYDRIKKQIGKSKEELSQKSRKLIDSFPLRHIQSIFATTKGIGQQLTVDNKPIFGLIDDIRVRNQMAKIMIQVDKLQPQLKRILQREKNDWLFWSQKRKQSDPSQIQFIKERQNNQQQILEPFELLKKQFIERHPNKTFMFQKLREGNYFFHCNHPKIWIIKFRKGNKCKIRIVISSFNLEKGGWYDGTNMFWSQDFLYVQRIPKWHRMGLKIINPDESSQKSCIDHHFITFFDLFFNREQKLDLFRMLNIDFLNIYISNINCFPIINIPKRIYSDMDVLCEKMLNFKQFYEWYDGKGYNFDFKDGEMHIISTSFKQCDLKLLKELRDIFLPEDKFRSKEKSVKLYYPNNASLYKSISKQMQEISYQEKHRWLRTIFNTYHPNINLFGQILKIRRNHRIPRRYQARNYGNRNQNRRMQVNRGQPNYQNHQNQRYQQNYQFRNGNNFNRNRNFQGQFRNNGNQFYSGRNYQNNWHNRNEYYQNQNSHYSFQNRRVGWQNRHQQEWSSDQQYSDDNEEQSNWSLESGPEQQFQYVEYEYQPRRRFNVNQRRYYQPQNNPQFIQVSNFPQNNPRVGQLNPPQQPSIDLETEFLPCVSLTNFRQFSNPNHKKRQYKKSLYSRFSIPHFKAFMLFFRDKVLKKRLENKNILILGSHNLSKYAWSKDSGNIEFSLAFFDVAGLSDNVLPLQLSPDISQDSNIQYDYSNNFDEAVHEQYPIKMNNFYHWFWEKQDEKQQKLIFLNEKLQTLKYYFHNHYAGQKILFNYPIVGQSGAKCQILKAICQQILQKEYNSFVSMLMNKPEHNRRKRLFEQRDLNPDFLFCRQNRLQVLHVAQLVLLSADESKVEQIWHINNEDEDNLNQAYFRNIQNQFKDPNTGEKHVQIGWLKINNFETFKTRLQQVEFDIRADSDMILFLE